MPPLAHWVHTPHPFLIQFTDTIGIRYYGLAYVLGFVAGALMLQYYAKARRSLLPAEKVWDFIVVLVVGVMLGGRLGSFLFYSPEALWRDPLSFFRVWDGGMASHGGMIGVALATWLYARWQKLPFLHLGDLIVSVAPIGLLLGRFANFINGELWGKISDVPWAVIFPTSAPGLPVEMILPRHPSQLYEAALEGAFLLAYLQHRFWRNQTASKHPGQLTGEFMIGYAIVRIFCEFFRQPDEGVTPILGLSRGTFYSLFMILAGVSLLLVARRQPAINCDKPTTSDSSC